MAEAQTIPAESEALQVRQRHANDTRFLNLLAAKQPYGWQKDGPDYSKFALMPRGLYD